jgi:hypothetical protein
MTGLQHWCHLYDSPLFTGQDQCVHIDVLLPVVWLGWIDDVLRATDCSRGVTLRSVLLVLDLLGDDLVFVSSERSRAMASDRGRSCKWGLLQLGYSTIWCFLARIDPRMV